MVSTLFLGQARESMDVLSLNFRWRSHQTNSLDSLNTAIEDVQSLEADHNAILPR